MKNELTLKNRFFVNQAIKSKGRIKGYSELDEKIMKLTVEVKTLVKMGAAEIPETREAASSRKYNQLSMSSKEEA